MNYPESNCLNLKCLPCFLYVSYIPIYQIAVCACVSACVCLCMCNVGIDITTRQLKWYRYFPRMGTEWVNRPGKRTKYEKIPTLIFAISVTFGVEYPRAQCLSFWWDKRFNPHILVAYNESTTFYFIIFLFYIYKAM